MNAREGTPRRYPGATMSRKACQMSARTVKVASASGLHARPAALFSQAASEQPAAVTIETADAGPVKASSILMLLTLESLAGTALVFALWGLSGFASVVALQHRLASIRPAHSAIVLSWYSTGMYVGISLAPVVGAAVLLDHGPLGLAISAAIAAAIALVMTVPVRSRA